MNSGNVRKNLEEMRYDNVVIVCFKSEKSTKELTAEYVSKLKESIGNEQAFLYFNQWTEQKDRAHNEKLGRNVEPMLFRLEYVEVHAATRCADLLRLLVCNQTHDWTFFKSPKFLWGWGLNSLQSCHKAANAHLVQIQLSALYLTPWDSLLSRR